MGTKIIRLYKDLFCPVIILLYAGIKTVLPDGQELFQRQKNKKALLAALTKLNKISLLTQSYFMFTSRFRSVKKF